MELIFKQESEVESFITKTPPRMEAWWDGWDLVVWQEYAAGWMKKTGLQRNGKWGVATRVRPDSKGFWKVKIGNIK